MQKEPNSFEEMKENLLKIAKEIVEKKKDSPAAINYDANASNALSTDINKEVIAKFSEAYKTYKFCSSCLVVNNKEGGVHLTSHCFWEDKLDGNVQYETTFPAVKVFLSVFVIY